MRLSDKGLATLPLNDEGRVDGFQFGGRARAIALWKEKKEEKAFKKLCYQLYQRRYQRLYYQNNAQVREASKRRLTARRRDRVVVRTCRKCGVEWCNVPGFQKGGRPPSIYCSKRCRVRWHNRQLVETRKRSGFWKKNWRRWDKRKRAK